MLARTVAPTADFQALALYFLNGKSGNPSPDRVAWSRSHNLPSDDVLLAADLMAASARLNTRTTKPCYHLMVGWAPNERPTPDQMQTIAVETLRRAGLSEHQAFIMGHCDTEHDHLHMMINRVHPETGATWKPSHDWRLFDRIMRELADEHGFQFVPAKSFNPDLTHHKRTKPNRGATYAAKRGASTSRPQWSRAEAETYGERLSSRLDPASTWDDLAHLVEADGLTLAPKGRGYVVGNADAYVKLSALNLTRTAKSRDTPQADVEELRFLLQFSDVQLALRQPDVARVFAAATTYAELALGLQHHGLTLEPVGKAGLLLTDGLHQISLAQLQLDDRRYDLLSERFDTNVINRLRKLGSPDLSPDNNVETSPAEPHAQRIRPHLTSAHHQPDRHIHWPLHPAYNPVTSAPWLDAVDIAKGLANWGLATTEDVRNALDQVIAERTTRLDQSTPLMCRLLTTTTLTQQRPPARAPRRSRPPNAPSR